MKKAEEGKISEGSSREGFTLLEILVALAIFSVIIAALYSTFFISQRAVEAVDDSIIRLQEARTLVDTVRRELESSYYEPGKSYTLFKLDDRDFYGRQASQLTFTAFTSLLPGLAKITYAVEEKDGKLIVTKKVASAFARTGETKGIELVEDIEAFTVEMKYGDRWIRTWDSALAKARLPDEIRVSLSIRSSKRAEEERKEAQSVMTISDIARPKAGGMI